MDVLPSLYMQIAQHQQRFLADFNCLAMDPFKAGMVWPWQMDPLDEGAFSIPVPVSPIEAGTYYIQILVRGDPESIPFDTDPAGGLPLPGDSFCGGALVLRALGEGENDTG